MGNVPELRFPEFSGEWREVSLAHIIQSLDAGVSVNSLDKTATENEVGILKTSCVTNGQFEPSENKVVLDEKEKNRLKEPVVKDTIIISRMNTPTLVGANALVKESKPNLYLPDRLWAAKVSQDESVVWLSFVLASKKVRALISARATGTSNSMKNITKKDIFTLPISIPSLPEQQKIADFLTAIDEKITILTDKITQLQTYKKGMMQKLLSGELRFPGFTDEWREMKLGEISSERKERCGDCDYELLAVTGSAGVIKRDELEKRDSSNSDKSKYRVVRVNDIAYNTMRMWQGTSGVSKYEGIVSPAYTVMHLKEVNDIRYFGYLFKTSRLIFDFYRFSQGLTSDTWNLKFHQFAEISVKIPLLKAEQEKIADFLTAIDDKLTIEQEKLDQLKRYKQGLLQKMFI